MAWSLALFNRYEDFDSFINAVVIDTLDKYAEGRADPNDIV